MYTNDSITVFNRVVINGVNKYQVTIIKGVFIESSKGYVVDSVGNKASNIVDVRIPVNSIETTNDRVYTEQKKFDQLIDKSGNWTLRDSDFFIRGEIESDGNTTFNDMINTYDNCYKVNQVRDYKYGSVDMQHIFLGGK